MNAQNYHVDISLIHIMYWSSNGKLPKKDMKIVYDKRGPFHSHTYTEAGREGQSEVVERWKGKNATLENVTHMHLFYIEIFIACRHFSCGVFGIEGYTVHTQHFIYTQVEY